MKIVISGFGPINRYEFDVDKDFHVVFGENNIGKSYGITLIYLVIKSILKIADFSPYFMGFEPDSEAKKEAKKLIKSNSAGEFSINDVVEKVVGVLISKTFLEHLNASLESSFEKDSIVSKVCEKEFSVFIDSKDYSLDLCYVENALRVKEFNIKRKVVFKNVVTNRAKREDGKKIVLYNNKRNSDHFIREFTLYSFVCLFGFAQDVAEKVGSVHFLPASRSGLYQALSAFGQIVAELSQRRAFLTNKIELPSIPEPLTDYFLELSEINAAVALESPSEMTSVADFIEKEILKGDVYFDDTTKKIMYSPQGTDLRLDAALTSSMVAEISPIVSFLKYVLPGEMSEYKKRNRRRLMYRWNAASNNKKPIIFIEEPEAHLHPKTQVSLVEAFSKLSSSGVKVVLTTHSNFVYNKINNLIISGEIDFKNVEVTLFNKLDCGSCGQKIKVDAMGFDDQTFGDVIDSMMDERISLLEEKNKNVRRDN